MFEKKDQALFDSLISKFSTKGESGGRVINKLGIKIIKITIMTLSVLIIGGIAFFSSFFRSTVSKTK